MANPSPGPNRRTLVAPGLITGFATAKHPAALPEGIVPALYDIRLDDGTPRLRPGSLPVCAAVSSGSWRGAYETRMGGVPTLFVATASGGKVSVFASTDEGATFSALPMTSPDVRLTDAGPVFFSLVSYRSTDYLIVQNGTDAPRYWDGTSMRIVPTLPTTGFRISTNLAFESGTVFTGSVPVAFVTDEFNLKGTTKVKPYSADTGANVLYLQCDGKIDSDHANNSATFGPLNDPFTISTDLTRQVVFVLDSGVPPDGVKTNSSDEALFPQGVPDERWRGLTISGSADGTTWFTIYEQGISGLITILYDDTLYLCAVPVTAATAGQTVNYLRFHYPVMGEGHVPDVITRFYTFANSGSLPGGATYGASFGQPGVLYPNDGPSRSGGILSPEPVTASYGGHNVPNSQLIGYTYRVRPRKTNAAVVPTYFYRKTPGTDGYYYVGSFNSNAGFVPFQWTDPGNDPDFTLALPDPSTLTLPTGTSMASVNGRLLVCGGSRFWYSVDSNPFAYTQLVLFDSAAAPIASSGGSFAKAGETFVCVVAIGQVPTGAEADGTPQTGAVTVYLLSDRTTYVISGWDALSLNKSTPIGIGTRSPLSVARRQAGGFYFLDSQSQVRRVDGTQLVAISKHVVDDQLRGIPAARLPWVGGVCVADRLFLAFTPSGAATNTRALVFNDAIGWESIDRPAFSLQGLMGFYSPSLARTRLYGFTDAGISEHSAPGATTEVGGARVSARIVFPEQGSGSDLGIHLSAFFIQADVDAGGTMSVSVQCSTGNDGGGTITFNSFDLTPQGAGWTRVVRRTVPQRGTETLTVVPTLDALASGGTRVIRLEMESSAGTSRSTQ